MDTLVMDNFTIFVKHFSRVPGSRELDEGAKAHTGEDFRINFLEPAFDNAIMSGKKLTVNLDGTIGYGTSWLEEVFGGMVRKYGREKVNQTIRFVSIQEPYLIEDIQEYIDNA